MLERSVLSTNVLEICKLIHYLFILPFRLFNYLSDYYTRIILINKETKYSKIINAVDIHEICYHFGYKVENHVLTTRDGYILTIHRIYKEKIIANKPIVYLHHGLITNSEIFVLGETASKSLPFLLVDQGYDVWLGNNRGNKYSRKHINLKCSSKEFWDFSLDEFAMFDTPDTISHVLKKTKQKDLVVIGFSQGATQTLAALSLSESLNQQIKLFIGISPSMTPNWVFNPIVYLFIKFPNLIYFIFGRKSLMPSGTVLIVKLMGPFFRLFVDTTFYLLFDWRIKNLTNIQKQMVYPHVFSPSSVKSIVHWLQIIKSHSFQMYDSVNHSFISKLSSTTYKLHKVTEFPINTITTKIMLIYGSLDNLVEIMSMEKGLINCKELKLHGIQNYEHIDVLWAKNVEKEVFKPILKEINELNEVQNDEITDAENDVLENKVTILKIQPLKMSNPSKVTEIIDKFNIELESKENEKINSQGSVFV